MDLKEDLYTQIRAKEEKWIRQINENLMTPIYCEYELKPFYLEKRSQLQNNNNELLSKIKAIIDSIILELDNIYNEYRSSMDVDFKTLSNLFLTSQMNNKISNKESKQIQNDYENDYLYDDFPEDYKKMG